MTKYPICLHPSRKDMGELRNVTQSKVLKPELPACREFWTSIPDVLSPHGASLDLAIAPEGLLKVIILERVDLDSLNEKLDTVMIR